AHSLLFFGSSRTRRSNSFQSSTVYSSSIILPSMCLSNMSATLVCSGNLPRHEKRDVGESDKQRLAFMSRRNRRKKYACIHGVHAGEDARREGVRNLQAKKSYRNGGASYQERRSLWGA